MSKSGSRFGRRSNWFKIHCLLQEQQQHQHTNQPQQQPPQQQRHQDTSSQNVDQSDTKTKKGKEGEVSIPVNHVNQSAQTNHFLTNLKSEKKRKKSWSDSGASSTDPDYIPAIIASSDMSSDLQHHHHQHIRRLIDESFISSNAVATAAKVLSAHSALPPYLLASSRDAHHLSAFLETSGKEIRSYKIPLLSPLPSSSLKRSAPFNLFVQNEPMDLSVKSTKETEPSSSQRALRTCIASHRTSDSSSNQILDDTTKPVPLDLTL